MGRILAIDYGQKRTGLAVTDEMKIIATALDTVPTDDLMAYLKDYVSREKVEEIIIGNPKNLDGSQTHNTIPVQKFFERIKNEFNSLKICLLDERLTSKIAFQTMIDVGLKKKDRRKKESIDKLSATIILQDYLEQRKF